MTARKHFKQLVRDRMRSTGEKYTVARRHIEGASPEPWELRGGVHGDTAAIANVLANLGVEHDGAPLSEAMVLGVGGGLGAGYILWEFKRHDYRTVVLGFRRLWQYPDRWATETAARLGLHAAVHETGGARAAASALSEQLDRGLPAIVWVDDEQLGLKGEPAWREGHGGPPVVIYGRAGDSLLVDDRSLGRTTVSSDVLTAARGRVVSYKNRLIAIDPARVDLDLVPAVQEGLQLQVAHLSERSDSFSLPAWTKWARMVNDPNNKKGWPTVFADGRGTASLRASIYTGATEGAALRSLYAVVPRRGLVPARRRATERGVAGGGTRLGSDRRRGAHTGRRAPRSDRRVHRGLSPRRQGPRRAPRRGLAPLVAASRARPRRRATGPRRPVLAMHAAETTALDHLRGQTL